MIKLIIFFRRPANVEAFEEHFSHRHVPLIAAMPGVVRTSVARAIGAPRGEPPYYLIHEVYFADMAALNYALNSAQGRAAGADLMAFARDIVSLMFAEVWGEDSAAGAERGQSSARSDPSPQAADGAAPQASSEGA
ncbi:MAG: EthD family reductase [Thermoflexales bacterium]|nr:EthD family reductase [Thermoflexales bacterium]MDW8350356.1 EthD family reductase [Anaerolineae bacterium]